MEVFIIAKMLHLLICKKEHASKHESQKDEDKCYWYIEEQLENLWEQRDHLSFLNRANKLLELADMQKRPEDFSLILNKVLGISTQINFLTSKHPELRDIITTVLNGAIAPSHFRKR